MMLQFRARREQGESFNGRDTYLASKTGAAFPYDAWLCHAVEQVNEPLTNGADSRPRAGPSRGFPWITLVLGSGCLEARDSTDDRAVDRLAEGVGSVLAERTRLLDDTDPARLAQEFAMSLVHDRLGRGEQPTVDRRRDSPASQPGDPSPGCDVVTAELMLLSALLTRFFYQAKALATDAPHRWGDDVAVLDRSTQEAHEIESVVLDPSRELLSTLATTFEQRGGNVNTALAEFLRAIDSTLSVPPDRDPHLHANHLHLLAECAWYSLTRDTTVYPGWSDLLLGLSMHGPLLPVTHGRPRPAFNSLDFGPDLIKRRYLEVTARSWATIKQGTPSERDLFYNSAARVLREQARLRARTVYASKPPVASAFVTTFDLELEMALWAQAVPTPYLLALPVYIFGNQEDARYRIASICWLGCVVTPDRDMDHDAQLERLRRPDQWFVLSNFTNFDSSKYADMPIVVRLSGCPLIELPAISDDPGQLSRAALDELFLEGSGQGNEISISHAVLLDEYAAMQQNAAEIYRYGANTETKSEKWYGLPTVITGVKAQHTHARFWMVMGVQMGDSGIRYRVASHIASPAMSSPPRPPARSPLRSGVVVNRRLDTAEQDLLYWYSFDVVRAPCQHFQMDLDHYVRHLKSPGDRSAQGQQCPIR